MDTTMLSRRRWLVVLASILLLAGLFVAARPVPALAAVQPSAGQYVPLTPARILTSELVPADDFLSFSPLGRGGVPAAGVSAVALNITVTSTAVGFLSVYPASATRPGSSTLNYRAGLTVANAAVVALGTGNQVSIYNSNVDVAARTHVDVTGYFRAAGSSAAGSVYVPLTPARIATQTIKAGSSAAIAPLGQGGVPSANVSAVLAHVTASSGTPGWMSVYPDGIDPPGTSTVNYRDDPAYTNQVTATLGSNGQFRVYTTQDITLVVDVIGYYQTPAGTAAGGSFVGLPPSRVLTVTVDPGTIATATLAGLGGIPASGVSAAAFNLTASGPTATGALTVWASGVTRPVARQLSYRTGATTATFQVTKLSPDGKFQIYNSGTAAVKLYVDVFGYYRSAETPGTPTGVTAVPDNGGATVSWTAPYDGGASVSKYTVTASPGGATTVVTAGTGVRVGGLTNGTAYTFSVTATNAAGTSVSSVASPAVTPAVPGPPGRPFITDVVGRHGAVLVSWSPPPGGADPATGYLVRATPGTASLAVSGGATTSATLTGLTNGTTYRLTVAATNANGTGVASAPSRPVLPASAQLPLRPVVTAVIALDQRVDLQWVAPPDGGAAISGYRVTVSPGEQVLTIPAGTTVASVTGLTNGTARTFRVAAVNIAGTGPATTVTSTPVAARVPAAPTDIQVAVPAGGQLTASWQPPADTGTAAITGYTVTAAPGGATVSVGAGATTATLTGLGTTTAYTLTVRATSTAGSSAASATTGALTPVFTGKLAPVVLSAASLATLRAVRQNGSLEFVSPPAQVTGLTAGALVVLTPGPLAPQGFYGRVTSLGTGAGTLVVNTVPAAINEAVTDGGMTLQGTLTTDDVASFTPSIPGVRLAEPTIAGKTARTGAASAAADVPSVGLRDGSLVVEWEVTPFADDTHQPSAIELQMQLTPGYKHTQTVTAGKVSSTLTLTTDIELQALGKIGYVRKWESKQKELGRVNGRCVVKTVGYLPVVVCPRYIVYGQLSADAGGGLFVSVEYARSVTAGVTVTNGSVTSTAASSRKASPITPTASVFGQSTFEAGVVNTIGFFFYGAAGPTVNVRLYLQFFADTTQDPWWELRGGITVTTALKSDAYLGEAFTFESGKLVDVFDSLAQAPGPFTGLQITPDDPRTPLTSLLRLGVKIVGYPAGIPIVWSVVTGPGTIDQTGTYAPAAVGTAVIKAESPAVVDGHPLLTTTTTVLVGPGRPGIPMQVTATPDDNAAEVTWQPPNTDNGSPVTSYVLTTSPPTTTVYTDAAARKATITGLKVGVEYRIEVHAVNTVGTSPPGVAVGFLQPLDGSFLPLGAPAGNIFAGDPTAGGVVRLSRNGRWIVYEITNYSPFAPPELAAAPYGLYLIRRDLLTGRIVLAGKATDGTPIRVGSSYDIDGSGTVVAYTTSGSPARVLVADLAAGTVRDVTTGKIPGRSFTARLSADGSTLAVAAVPETGSLNTAYRVVIAGGTVTKVGKCTAEYTCSGGAGTSNPPTASTDGRYIFLEEEVPRASGGYIGGMLYDSATGTTTELHPQPPPFSFTLPSELVSAVSGDVSTIGGTNRLGNGVTGAFVKRGLTATVSASDMIFTNVSGSGVGADAIEFSDDGRVAVVRVFDVSTTPTRTHTEVWFNGALVDLAGSSDAGYAAISGNGRVVSYSSSAGGFWLRRLS
ncbi:fibronectin type III domain-containing protein [Actinoplanes sp. NPDC051494]|uniref:fibronectin type III domain-containing protein n=1 Tax=Actinoplanes sp. NPDC051494 TaxID=3363907 RepID=UPI0037BBD7C1